MPQPNANADEDFDAIFAQAASELSAKTGDEPKADTETTAEPAGPTAPAAAPQAEAATSTAQTESKDEKPAAPEAAPAPASDIERKLAELQHAERSASSRISAFARQNQQLQHQLSQALEQIKKLTSAGTPAVAAPAAPSADDVLSKAPDLDAAVRKRVQEIVEPVVNQVKEAATKAAAVEEKTERIVAQVAPITEKEHQKTIEETWKKLDEDFTPKWREDLASSDFKAFIERAPKEVRALHERAVTPEECADVLDLFYAKRGGRPRPQAAPTETTTTESAAPAQPSNPQLDRLRQSAGIPSRGTGRPSAPAESDFDGAFARATAELRRQSARI